MQLFILRHGDAPFDQTNGERALSQQGVIDTQQIVADRLKELKAIEHIVCSPVLRARQTLDVVTNCLGNFGLRVTFENCLKSESSIERVTRFMSQCPEQSTLLVTHQPLVGQLVNYLDDSQAHGVMMGTSCLAAFDLLAFSRGGAQLQWLDCPPC